MSKLEYPSRIFSLSDCHGGRAIWDPLESPDIAACLADSIRSDFPGIERFDIHGAPIAHSQHIINEAVRLHQENPDSDRTGLFVNIAARTEANVNGQPFYRAEFDENVVVVATPLSVLSGVRDLVRKLLELPNEGNGLYEEREQNRSSFTPRLLAGNHGFELKEVDPFSIPELPEGCRVGYVDRFGNLVLSGVGEETKKIRQKIAENFGRTLKLQIGSAVHALTIGESLSRAEPGSLVIYGNDGSIEILNKWVENWTAQERLERSAYGQYGKPEIGTSVNTNIQRRIPASGQCLKSKDPFSGFQQTERSSHGVES